VSATRKCRDEKKDSAQPVPWERLRRLYILDPAKPTLARLAKRFKVPYATLRRRAVEEKWARFRHLAGKLPEDDDHEALGRLLGKKAVEAILSAELIKASEAARLLELAMKLTAAKSKEAASARYVAEWGKGK